MQEILPGLWHWTAEHPKIHITVSSHYLADGHTVFDPLPPEQGNKWFDTHPVERVVLSNRHHLRGARELGKPIYAPQAGMHEFEGAGIDVKPYGQGDEVAPGVTAHSIGALAPDDFALHIASGPGALLLADALVHYGEEIGFVPDKYMDDPKADKARTYERLQPLLSLEFDALLFAHGNPIPAGGRDALKRFVDSA